MVWDFVYAQRLLSNGTYRPTHDAVLGFEHCMVAKARLEALRHPDGTPVYRVEETKPLLGSSRAPRMEAERPKQRRWNGVDDPIGHCLAGNSLLLTGLPDAPRPDHCGEAARAGRGVRLVSKTHCSAQNLGLGAQTADHWVRRYVRGGSAQKLDWLVVHGGDHAAGHGALGGPGLRGAERRREVPAAGRLPAVAGRAGLLGRAAHQRAVGAQPAHPRPGRAHGEHALLPRDL